ncbi:hypothetical protein KY366_07575 [Candidatus Woesearchaeota archaeon]|nr:hypothetical protein [Candidatus Woesearchaeota archaeon]
MTGRKCINCGILMKKTFVEHRGMRFEARQCPKCKEKIFTEDLTMKAISKLESKRLQREYVKHPMKIGHSWGMTFPKDMAEVFNLSNPKIRLSLHPKLSENKIEIILKE